MDKYIGKKLDGRYEILEIIGVGGMANVYKAYDVLEDKFVAIKILRDEFLSDPELLRRFKNESKAIAVLSHSNIVKVFDVSFNDKYQSIVMEFINGITLKEYIDQQGVIKWKEAVHFVTQVLMALQHAHDKGIVHRDIKPQNVMLLTDGTIKVMDFGIARFTNSESRTMTDKAIGSVHYISPEQARGEQTDEKTDIYSLGVMLFEMLTGKLPFEAETAVSVALKQIQTEPNKPTQLNPNIPEGLEQIILKAMKKNPAERYQSATEMLADIDQFKLNPSIHFEYKYFIDSNPTRHMEKIKVKNSDDPNYHETKQKSPAISILSGIAIGFVIVALMFVVGAVWLINPFQPVEETVLPPLVGQKYQDVIESSEYDNIEIVNGGTTYNTQYEAGYICAQDPKAGREVKVGAVVTVTVSKGAKAITLYDLENYDTITAETHLRSLGLTWTEIPIYSNTVTKGYVVRTMPEAQTEVTEGSSITLYISQGPEEKKVIVRDFTLINVDDAKRVITKNNLVVGTITPADDSEYPEGVVISQSLVVGTETDTGAEINLTISSGRSSLTNVTVKVDLDGVDIEKPVFIEAILDGKTVSTDIIDPSAVEEWTVTVEGTGTSKLVVKLDDRIYQEFKVDFDQVTYSVTTNNKKKFK